MAGEEPDVAEPSDNEVRARESGWAPKEEWKGKPEHWKTADEWLEQAPKNYIPKLEKQIGKLTGQLAKLEAETEDRIKRLDSAAQTAIKRERDKLEEDYQARILKATETGDTEAARKAMSDQKRDMEKLGDKAEAVADKQELKDTKAASDLPPEVVKRLESWLEDNDWYGKSENRRIARQFDFLYVEVEEDMPTATIMERLEETRSRLSKANPSKFGGKQDDDEEETTSRRGPRVESGSRNTNGGPKKKGWSDIDSEDRRMAESMIGENKLFKDKSDYAADYWKAQDEDARA